MEEFLTEIGLGAAVNTFREHNIKLEQICNLLPDEIKELLPRVGDRETLRKGIERKRDEEDRASKTSKGCLKRKRNEDVEDSCETFETHEIAVRGQQKLDLIIDVLKKDDVVKVDLINKARVVVAPYLFEKNRRDGSGWEIIDVQRGKLNCPLCSTQIVPQYRKNTFFDWMVENYSRHLQNQHGAIQYLEYHDETNCMGNINQIAGEQDELNVENNHSSSMSGSAIDHFVDRNGDINAAPNGDINAAPNGDINVVPNSDINAVSVGDINAVPVVDINAVPDGDINAVPDGDINAVPDGDINAVPNGDINAVPVVDINAVPVVDINAVPNGDINAVPNGDINAVPVVDINAVPVVDINAVPVVDINAVPVVDINAVPVVDINAVPVVDINAVPNGDINAVPNGDINAVPNGDINAVPNGDINAVPNGDINAVPVGDINAVPNGDINAVPVGDINAVPNGDANVQIVPDWQGPGATFGWIRFNKRESFYPGFSYEDNLAQFMTGTGELSDIKRPYEQFLNNIPVGKKKKKIINLIQFNALNGTSFQ